MKLSILGTLNLLAGDFIDGGAENFAALAETAIFLGYFKEMPDNRQSGKGDLSARRNSAPVLLAVWRAAKRSPKSRGSAKRS